MATQTQRTPFFDQVGRIKKAQAEGWHECAACLSEGGFEVPCDCRKDKSGFCVKCGGPGVTTKACPTCKGVGRVNSWALVLDGLKYRREVFGYE